MAEHWADEILEIADDATNDWMGRQRRDGVTEIVLNRVAGGREHAGNQNIVDRRGLGLGERYKKDEGE